MGILTGKPPTCRGYSDHYRGGYNFINLRKTKGMDTKEKLIKAKALIEEAGMLVEEAMKNTSLSNYYGYTLLLMNDDLTAFSDNKSGFLGVTSLEDIIEDEGIKWQN